MCGIAGFIGSFSTEFFNTTLLEMGQIMNHRGPDGYGTWISPSHDVGFVHRRLSIIDLTDLGKQPMVSNSGRYVVTFNGEIYNYRSLRDELIGFGCAFRGQSDTEVLLSSIEHWGINNAVKKFIGMFSFAIWDKENHTMSLVRDRLGIKPLYYYQSGNDIAFASELVALSKCPYPINKIDKQALSLYMKYRYIPGSNSIFENVSKVTPGTICTFHLNGVPPDIEEYWNLIGIAEAGQQERRNLNQNEYVEELESLLEDSIRMRMIADVPLGGFLSGGIDSSVVVSLMQKQSFQPINTYTIGFKDIKFNEAERALAVAKHLGVDSHVLYLEPSDMLKMVGRLPYVLSEPMADISILPMLMVSELAAKDVKVVLSGDGGDELFCGYNSYTRAENWERKLGGIPDFVKNLAASGLGAFFSGGGKLARLASLLSSNNHEKTSQILASLWQDTSGILKGINHIESAELKTKIDSIKDDIRHYMMLKDTGQYMVDDILTKVDRASMAHSIEARVPILDHRVVELAWQMPLSVKCYNGQSKWPLRQILNKYVPKAVYEAPKQGFDVPISSWLRSDLRPWAEELIYSDMLKNNEYIEFSSVERLWNEHQSRHKDRGAYLWSILLFLNWQHEYSLGFSSK